MESAASQILLYLFFCGRLALSVKIVEEFIFKISVFSKLMRFCLEVVYLNTISDAYNEINLFSYFRDIFIHSCGVFLFVCLSFVFFFS